MLQTKSYIFQEILKKNVLFSEILTKMIEKKDDSIYIGFGLQLFQKSFPFLMINSCTDIVGKTLNYNVQQKIQYTNEGYLKFNDESGDDDSSSAASENKMQINYMLDKFLKTQLTRYHFYKQFKNEKNFTEIDFILVNLFYNNEPIFDELWHLIFPNLFN